MAFKKHFYGSRKAEIKALLRKKINHQNRMRYHEKMYRDYEFKTRVVQQLIENIERENKGGKKK